MRGVARRDDLHHRGHSHDFTPTCGVLSKGEAYDGKQSGSRRGLQTYVKKSDHGWNLEAIQNLWEKPSHRRARHLSTARFSSQHRSLAANGRPPWKSLKSPRSDQHPPLLHHFELFVVRSATRQFNYNELCKLSLPTFLITSAGLPPTDFQTLKLNDFRSRSIVKPTLCLQIKRNAPPPHAVAQSLSK